MISIHRRKGHLLVSRVRYTQGRTYVDHGGSNKGTISQLTNYWQQGVVVALHSNVDPSPHLAAAAQRIAQLYLAPAESLGHR